MKIYHNGNLSYVEGKLSEKATIDKWLARMKEIHGNRFDCFCDESEDDNICLIWGMEFFTQADRQEAAQYAKSTMKR